MSDTSTAATLAAQWSNPTGFLSLLMIIGGPVIQVSLAQLTGPKFVPICFSFGWISYIFSMIPALAGDGRLMPTPDYACKVVNLENGYARTNRSWMIGRLLRDLEATKHPEPNVALRVVVYRAEKLKYRGRVPLAFSQFDWLGLVGIIFQLAISIIPVVLNRDWAIVMITGAGTVFCLATAALPQWRAEKLACRDASSKKIGITIGNGSGHVVVILGEGNCLDLEDMAASESPRHARPWNKWGLFVKGSGEGAETRLWYSLPADVWATRLFWAVSVLFWTALLLSVVALKANAWFLIAVGTIGMFQHAFVAASSRDPETRGVRLVEDVDLVGEKAMDVLMDLQTWEPGCGKSLLKEFFPGDLDVSGAPGEKEWWDAATKKKVEPHETGDVEELEKKYEEKRYADTNKNKRFDDAEIAPGKPKRGRIGGLRRP